MTPEGKVKVWLDKQLDLFFPGHWRYKPRGGPFAAAGASDYFIVWQGVFIALEVKSDTGSLTALQLACLKQIERAGGVAAVIRGRDLERLRAVKSAVMAKLEGKT